MCPHCGREGHLTLFARLVATAVAPPSLAGATLALPDTLQTGFVSCGACGWAVWGHLEGAAITADAGFVGGTFVSDTPPLRP